MPVVSGLAFDDVSREKMAIHGISERRALEVLDDPHIIVPNRKDRRGTYLLIGRDHGGACVALPIEPTRDPVIWRPITAWPCKDNERARLQRSAPRD